MTVGAPILPCCCDQPEGDCGGLTHASAPDTISVAGGYTSTVYRRTRNLCAPNCNQYDIDACCDFITTMTISFQGLLLKTPSSAWSASGNRSLYTNFVEFEWSISQEVIEGNCSGQTAHSESGSATYDDPTSSLPYVRITCCRPGGGTAFGCAGPPLATCSPILNPNAPALDSPEFLNPSPIVGSPYLRLQFFTESGNQGVASDAPSRPSFPWQGIATQWPQWRCLGFGCPGALVYLNTSTTGTIPGVTDLNWWRPSQFSWVKGGSQIGGLYSPIVSQHPMQEAVPRLLFDANSGEFTLNPYTACEVSPVPGSIFDIPCDPPAAYDFAGTIAAPSATVSV
jgi:hypothetical protein